MDKVEFIKAIKEVVSESAIKTTIENLVDPPGRRPSQKLLDQSEWFNSLNSNDRTMVQEVISEAVHESVFGLLCVLDGTRSISNSGESNNLNLSHGNVQLNDDQGEFLHDIYTNV